MYTLYKERQDKYSRDSYTVETDTNHVVDRFYISDALKGVAVGEFLRQTRGFSLTEDHLRLATVRGN